MPAVVVSVAVLEPTAPATSDFRPRPAVVLEDEETVEKLDDDRNRIFLFFYNYGPDDVELIRPGLPAQRVSRLDGGGLTGGGEVSVRLAGSG